MIHIMDVADAVRFAGAEPSACIGMQGLRSIGVTRIRIRAVEALVDEAVQRMVNVVTVNDAVMRAVSPGTAHIAEMDVSSDTIALNTLPPSTVVVSDKVSIKVGASHEIRNALVAFIRHQVFVCV
jgi:hypothetical protein